jgi:cyclophilin family peptidyl-prolyl cis-trans isomerase
MFGFLASLFGLACTSSGGTPADEKPTQQAAQSKPAAASSPTPIAGGATPKQWGSAPQMAIDANKQYTATFDTTKGKIVCELFAKEAPNTVNNFVFLAREGFYSGVPFHRIISGFMVQTGDPTGTGRGGPGYRFADELPSDLNYEKGTLAMANAGPNTQGSQFFICHDDLTAKNKLPKNYTIFGKVTSGLDVLDKIATSPVRAGPSGEPSQPTVELKINSVSIEER